MKFRAPKTGEVFEDIQSARISFCVGRICSEDCPFGCSAEVERDPAEAARLMGLEVVEDHVGDANEMVKEDTMKKTDKPLSEWTLKEVQVYCKERCSECENCKVYQVCNEIPNNWELIPCFTSEEVTDAKTLNALYKTGMDATLSRDCSGNVWCEFRGGKFPLPNKLFPSLRPGQAVKLEEII